MNARLAALFAACSLASGLLAQVPSTGSIAEASAWLASSGDVHRITDGPANRATHATASRLFTGGLGSAQSAMEAWAEYGRLRVMGSVSVTSTDGGASVGTTFPDDPDTAAYFEDRITVGGGGGPHTFRVFYRLSGVAGMSGVGSLFWGADLYAQAFGLSTTVLNSPSILRVGGIVGSAFSVSDHIELSVADGTSFNLLATMGAYLRVTRLSETSGTTVGSLDLGNSGTFYIVPNDPNTTFNAESGADYVMSPVSGSVWLSDLAGSPEGIPVTIEVREVGSTTPIETHVVNLSAFGGFEFHTGLTGAYDLAFKGPTWLREKNAVWIDGPTGTTIALANGDVNGDNSVNIQDFLVLRGAFGSTVGGGTYVPGADLNKDGSVNVFDFLILRSNFGRSGVN